MSTGGRRALVRVSLGLATAMDPCLSVILQTLHSQLYPAKSPWTLAIVAINPRRSPEEAKQHIIPTVKKGMPAHSFRQQMSQPTHAACSLFQGRDPGSVKKIKWNRIERPDLKVSSLARRFS